MRLTRLPLLALVLVAAGCGGSGGSGTTSASSNPPPVVTGGAPSDQLSQAAAATAGAGTYKTSFEMLTETASGPVILTGAGEFQADPPLGKVTMDFSAITGKAGGVEAIFDGSTMYMQIPGLAAGMSWIKIDNGSLADAAGLGSFSQIAQGDPTQILQYLQGTAGDLQAAGTETIQDGVEATKYTMTIDLNKAADQAETDELRQAILDSIETTGVSELPAEVWIDGDGYVRKMVTHYTGITTAEGVADLTVTVDLYDFGADVNIEIPSDDQVFDFGDLGGLPPTTTAQQ